MNEIYCFLMICCCSSLLLAHRSPKVAIVPQDSHLHKFVLQVTIYGYTAKAGNQIRGTNS